MVFNSFEFAVFFCIVLGLYWILKHRWQNAMLLAASYVFYGFWDWRFLSLIIFSTVLDYFCGLALHRRTDPRERKQILTLSLLGNLGVLGVFKYYNFFAGILRPCSTPWGSRRPPTSITSSCPWASPSTRSRP